MERSSVDSSSGGGTSRLHPRRFDQRGCEFGGEVRAVFCKRLGHGLQHRSHRLRRLAHCISDGCYLVDTNEKLGCGQYVCSGNGHGADRLFDICCDRHSKRCKSAHG